MDYLYLILDYLSQIDGLTPVFRDQLKLIIEETKMKYMGLETIDENLEKMPINVQPQPVDMDFNLDKILSKN